MYYVYSGMPAAHVVLNNPTTNTVTLYNYNYDG